MKWDLINFEYVILRNNPELGIFYLSNDQEFELNCRFEYVFVRSVEKASVLNLNEFRKFLQMTITPMEELKVIKV